MAIKILLIDDSEADRMLIKHGLSGTGKDIEVYEADCGLKGLDMLREDSFDCVFLDYILPDMDGVDFLREIYDQEETQLAPFPITLLTGQGDETVVIEAFNYGAQDYLAKDNISSNTLNITLTKARKTYALRKEIVETKRQLEAQVEMRTKELKKAMMELETIAQIPETNSNPVIRISEEGDITYINNSGLQFFPDLEVLELSHPIMEGVDDVLKTLKDEKVGVIIQEIEIGTEMTYLRTIAPIYTQTVKSLAVHVQNISNIKKSQKEAEKANHAKDDFLANMSHELRTPMNSILGLTKVLLEDEGLDDEHRETLRIIDRSSVSLLQIVNDILDLSKIEAGHIILEQRPFNLIGLMHSIVEQTKPLAKQKDIKYNTNIDGFESVNLSGDEFRLSRILINLIGNAVKYTPEGQVDVNIHIEEKDEDTVEFSCVVKDTGIGIAEDKIDYIFDKFTQAEESTARRFGGTGLGLNITKKLIELMNGKISIQSKIDEGSAFTITIPFEKTTSDQVFKEGLKQVKIVNVPDANRKHIELAKFLIAEDHEFNQIFILKLLKRLGCENFQLVTDGKAAIKALEDNDYDMVLMDYHMPEMNGYDATKAIRLKEKEGNADIGVPIIAMTADAMHGTREKCLAAGMSEYISKPIDEPTFQLLMQNWFILSDEKNKIISKRTQKDFGKKSLPANLSLLKEYSDNDPEVEKELIELFYKKSMTDIKVMEENAIKAKHSAWSEAAHGLKGSAGYIGALALQNLCNNAQLFEEGTAKERRQMLKKIKDEHDNICIFLKKEGFLYEEQF